jgi:multiple sugar transport system permease protein
MRKRPWEAARHRTWGGSALLVALGLLILVPFFWMFVTAFFGDDGGLAWRVHPDAVTGALGAAPIGRFFLNSIIVSLAVTALQVCTSTSAAYALARLEFPGRDRVLVAYLWVLAIPMVLLWAPRFLLISALGWVDSYAGLIATEFVSVGGILLVRQFLLAIPRDLEDAARLEGATEWTVFRRVTLPLIRPVVVTLAVLAFAEQWKSFAWPLVATRSTAMRVLEVGLAELHGTFDLNWPYQMVAATVGILPLAIVYVVCQRAFLRGAALTPGA